jgi:raffinose/stachyose/melibiose transport system permease protein
MKRVLSQGALYLVLAIFAIVALFPAAWMFLCAGKTEAEARANIWGLSASWTWGNFRTALFEYDFGRYLLNSVIVTVSAVAMTLAAAALAGFAFARVRFRGRSLAFYLFLAGMMVPVHIVLIPLLRTVRFLHIADTHAALVATYVAFSLPVSIFILRGFFEGVPAELEEAARIDGCSTVGVFWHVCLPAARPALAVVTIFNFVTLWNEFIFALTLLNAPERSTLPLGLYNFSQKEYGANVPLTCAALSMSVLPVILVYLLAQKHIIRGLTAGAIKG